MAAVILSVVAGALVARALLGLGRALSKRRWPAHRLALTAALLGLVLLQAMSGLDGLLKAMHLPDAPGAGGLYTVTGLTSVFDPWMVAQDTVESWEAWSTDTRVAGAGLAMRWLLGIDFGFVVLYGIALVVLLELTRQRHRRIRDDIGEDLKAQIELLPAEATRDRQLTEQRLAEMTAQSRLGTGAMRATVGLIAFDVVENALAWQWIGNALNPDEALTRFQVRALHGATGGKWLFSFLVLALSVPLLVWLATANRELIASFRATAARVRGLLTVTVVFGVIVLIPLQVPDVIRRWDEARAILAVEFAMLLGLVSYAFARSLMNATRPSPPDVPRRVSTRGLLVGALVLLILGVTSLVADWGAPGLIVPGAMLLVLAFLQMGAPETLEQAAPPAAGAGQWALPRLLLVAPIVLIGLGTMRARFADEMYLLAGEGALVRLVFWGVLPVLVAVAGYLIAERWEPLPTPPWMLRGGAYLLGVMLLLGWLLVLQIVLNVWPISQRLGAVALVGAFTTMVAAVVGAAAGWAERTEPPRSLYALGFKRFPIGLLLIVWLITADLVPGGKAYHDVSVGTSSVELAESLNPESAFIRWRRQQDLIGPRTNGSKRAVPMVFVSTAGGGIKAAVWTTFVLDCVFHGGPAVVAPASKAACEAANPKRRNRIESAFAASGISGGSLGLVEYVTHEEQSGGVADPRWIRRVLTDDFVSPNLAWQLFVETPRAFLRYDIGMDRAEVLERGWEYAWSTEDEGAAALIGRSELERGPLGEGFFSMQANRADLPLLMLNGTTVEGGCRFVTSLIETTGTRNAQDCSALKDFQDHAPEPTGPAPVTERGVISAASLDLFDFLCSDEEERPDIRRSTAALLSARFPYVSPTGRIPFCGMDDASVHVVDGGYLDGSGGGPIKDLWDAVAGSVSSWNRADYDTCIVPYLVQIDSGYESTVVTTDSVSELRAPPRANTAARSSRSVEGRNAAALAFHGKVEGVKPLDRYAILNLRANPGSEAPLGWTLSDASVTELEEQLSLNQDQLSEISGWFSGAGCD